MRAPILTPMVLAMACLMLAGCGSSRKTVVVNPAPGSTTVVESNGDTRVITPNN